MLFFNLSSYTLGFPTGIMINNMMYLNSLMNTSTNSLIESPGTCQTIEISQSIRLKVNI